MYWKGEKYEKAFFCDYNGNFVIVLYDDARCFGNG